MHAQPSVRDALAKTTHIAVTRNALPVVHTTAQALAHTLCPGAAIHAEPRRFTTRGPGCRPAPDPGAHSGRHRARLAGYSAERGRKRHPPRRPAAPALHRVHLATRRLGRSTCAGVRARPPAHPAFSLDHGPRRPAHRTTQGAKAPDRADPDRRHRGGHAGTGPPGLLRGRGQRAGRDLCARDRSRGARSTTGSTTTCPIWTSSWIRA